jgi:hypothetical protein
MELHLREIGCDYLGNEMYLKQLYRSVRRTLLEKCQSVIQLCTIIAVFIIVWIRRFSIKRNK